MASPSRAIPSSTRLALTAGWPVLVIAALAMVGTLPGRTQGLGLVTEPLLADLKLDRVAYASINLWATLIGALFCLPCGRLTDRYGARVVLTGVSLALGLSVVAMSQAASVAMLALTITLTRGLGQSALSVVSLALVGKRFPRNLNMAMAVYSLLVGIGFIAAFPTVGQSVLAQGWRPTWLCIGVTLISVLAPLSWIAAGRAENRGVHEGPGDGGMSRVSDLTLSAALLTPAFWIFALASSLFGLVYSGIALFNQSILEQRGFDAGTYHTVLVVSTMLGLAANFAGGWLASKWPIQKLTSIGMVVLAASLLMLPFVQTFAHIMIYASAMGIAGGVVTVVFFSVWGQAFGRAHLGRIQGCAQMMTVVASAVGPVILARTLERTGSYESIFFVLAACVAVLAVASWLVELPTRRG